MINIFSGLEAMGLGKMKDINLFDDDKTEEPEPVKAEVKKPEKPKFDETTVLLDKTLKCPVCDNTFKNKIVKTGKARLQSQDFDLRPQYVDFDALKYGIIVCPICGYATMAKTFGPIAPAQAKLVKQQISASFTGLGPENAVYTYEDAIARHKLALVNSVVKRSKISERAYTCLLIAWLLRGKAENMPENTAGRELELEELKAEETAFLTKARDGFIEAYQKETCPICGLDENTVIYLISALCFETGMNDDSLKWASRLIESGVASDRIKEKARHIKDLIRNS